MFSPSQQAEAVGRIQAEAVGVNYPRGLLQHSPSLASVGGFKQTTRASVIDDFAVRAGRNRNRARGSFVIRVKHSRYRRSEHHFVLLWFFPFSERDGRQDYAENNQHF